MGNVRVKFLGPMDFLDDGKGNVVKRGEVVSLDETDMQNRAAYGGVLFAKGEGDELVPETAGDPTPGLGTPAVAPVPAGDSKTKK